MAHIQAPVIAASLVRIQKPFQIRVIVFTARYRHLRREAATEDHHLYPTQQDHRRDPVPGVGPEARHVLIVHWHIAMWIIVNLDGPLHLHLPAVAAACQEQALADP